METGSRSPAWKNPRDRLVKHAKRKSNRSLTISQNLESVHDELNTESCPPVSLAHGENPFKVCPPKKKKNLPASPLKELPFDWDDSTANDSFSSIVSTKLRQSCSLRSIIRSKSIQFGDFSLDSTDAENSFLGYSPNNLSLITEEKTSTSLPKDFRLGTKLQIKSAIPFPWMKSEKSTGNVRVRLTGEEISLGMQRFLDLSNISSSIPATSSSAAASLLEAASLYWQFPSLPWLNLYPRIDSLLKTLPKQSAPPMAPCMVDKINEQWYSSLDQLFISWKKGKRKCFYVACPSFTVVFNKISNEENEAEQTEDSVSCFHEANGQKHVAIISPTNLGLRQYLKSEGIQFELSSYKRRRLSRIKQEGTDCVSEGNDDFRSENSLDGISQNILVDDRKLPSCSVPVGSDHEGESPTKGTNGVQEWLDDIGVSPRNQLKLRRHKSMVSTVTSLQANDTNKGAEKDCTSAVIISEGASLQSLFNLLQTSKITRSIAGSHANLPPTLIASEPFLFGQMLPLKKTSQVIKRYDQKTEYVLEFDGGPIMPHSIDMVAEYIRITKLAATNSVTMRVKDKAVYDGLNGVDQSSEWHDLNVEMNKFTWVSR